MGITSLKDKVEQALVHWNTHDDRYFELYDASAPIHGMPPDVPATVDG